MIRGMTSTSETLLDPVSNKMQLGEPQMAQITTLISLVPKEVHRLILHTLTQSYDFSTVNAVRGGGGRSGGSFRCGSNGNPLKGSWQSFRQQMGHFMEHLRNAWGSTSTSIATGNYNDGFLKSLLGDHSTPPMVMHETESNGKYIMSIVIGTDLLLENIKATTLLSTQVLTVEVKYYEKYWPKFGKPKQSEATFTFPVWIDATQVKSCLTPDGILQFEAPRSLRSGSGTGKRDKGEGLEGKTKIHEILLIQ